MAKPRLVSAITSHVEKARGEMEDIRNRVAGLKADLELEQGRPVPKAEVERRIDETITLLRGEAGRLLSVGELLVPGGGHCADGLRRQTLPVFVAVALAAPDALRSLLTERTEAAFARLPEPVIAEERARRVRDLTAALAETERQEAGLLWKAQEAGVEMGWRPDHDPAAVLGLD